MKSIKKLLNLCCVAGIIVMLFAPAALAVEGSAPKIQPIYVQTWGHQIRVESVQAAFLDDNGISCNPLVYNGTVYLPLQTVAKWMGADVTWTKDTKTVAFTSKKRSSIYPSIYTPEGQPRETAKRAAQLLKNSERMDAELRPDLHVTLDGMLQPLTNTMGTPIYPILFRNSVYLPVRSVAVLCNKNFLLFDPPQNYGDLGNTIYLYTAPTQDELEVARAYLMQCTAQMAIITAEIDNIAKTTNLTNKIWSTKLEHLKKQVQVLSALPLPMFPPFAQNAESLNFLSKQMIARIDTYLMPRAETESCWLSRERFLDAMNRKEDNLGAIDDFLFMKTWSEALLDAILENE